MSILSDAGVPLEDIARLVGHRSTTVTEAVYRKQLKPVLTEGAEAMNRLFGSYAGASEWPARAAKRDP